MEESHDQHMSDPPDALSRDVSVPPTIVISDDKATPIPIVSAPQHARQKASFAPHRSLSEWQRVHHHLPNGPLGRYSLSTVAKHNTPEDCWTVLNGKVYNISPFLDFHPGGRDTLLRAAGKDGTALFNTFHAWVNADAILQGCLVGFLVSSSQQEVHHHREFQ